MRTYTAAVAGILLSVVQAGPSVAAPRDRFFWLSQINKASAVMIVERGIVPKPLGASARERGTRNTTDRLQIPCQLSTIDSIPARDTSTRIPLRRKKLAARNWP